MNSIKVFQLHKLTIDCHAGRGDGSRISHLKLSYQILHEISSSLVPGVLDFHKCPLLCGVMRPNHLFFPRLHRSNIIGTPLGAVFLESFTNSDNLSQMKPWSMVIVTEKKEGVKYHSQSHTSIVPSLKNELLNSLLAFSSGKVLLCRQTQIRFGVPCNVFAAKTTMSQQHFRWLWRNLCVRVCIYCVFRVLLILNG